MIENAEFLRWTRMQRETKDVNRDSTRQASDMKPSRSKCPQHNNHKNPSKTRKISKEVHRNETARESIVCALFKRNNSQVFSRSPSQKKYWKRPQNAEILRRWKTIHRQLVDGTTREHTPRQQISIPPAALTCNENHENASKMRKFFKKVTQEVSIVCVIFERNNSQVHSRSS